MYYVTMSAHTFKTKLKRQITLATQHTVRRLPHSSLLVMEPDSILPNNSNTSWNQIPHYNPEDCHTVVTRHGTRSRTGTRLRDNGNTSRSQTTCVQLVGRILHPTHPLHSLPWGNVSIPWNQCQHHPGICHWFTVVNAADFKVAITGNATLRLPMIHCDSINLRRQPTRWSWPCHKLGKGEQLAGQWRKIH